uniref:Lipocalin n=1 Tax=Rhyparobia maderae TaxID=36963 RepID=O46130_RHYMA|nr:lipocalin [Rhyparobia maderae]
MNSLAGSLACLAVAILNVNGDCDFGPIFRFHPNWMENTWYVVYSSPSAFDEANNVSFSYELQGHSHYVAHVGITFADIGTAKEINGTVTALDFGTKFNVQLPEWSKYSGTYRVTALEYGNYLIAKGCPEKSTVKSFTVVMFSKKCPDEASVGAARAALKKYLNENLEHYAKDTFLNCP